MKLFLSPHSIGLFLYLCYHLQSLCLPEVELLQSTAVKRQRKLETSDLLISNEWDSNRLLLDRDRILRGRDSVKTGLKR